MNLSWLIHTPRERDQNRTGNCTSTIANNESWFLSLSQTSVNISVQHISTHFSQPYFQYLSRSRSRSRVNKPSLNFVSLNQVWRKHQCWTRQISARVIRVSTMDCALTEITATPASVYLDSQAKSVNSETMRVKLLPNQKLIKSINLTKFTMSDMNLFHIP